MEKSIEHQGCQLSYSVEGSGQSILFIQGVGVHGLGWLPQTDEISKSFQCIRFDNRGIGKSQPVEARQRTFAGTLCCC